MSMDDKIILADGVMPLYIVILIFQQVHRNIRYKMQLKFQFVSKFIFIFSINILCACYYHCNVNVSINNTTNC